MKKFFYVLLLVVAVQPVMGQATTDVSVPLMMKSNSPSRLSEGDYVLSEERAIELLGEDLYNEYSRNYERYHDGNLLVMLDTPLLAVLGAGAITVATLDKSYDGSKMLYLLGGGAWCVAAATLTAGIIMATKGKAGASKIIDDYNAGELTLSLGVAGLSLHF